LTYTVTNGVDQNQRATIEPDRQYSSYLSAYTHHFRTVVGDIAARSNYVSVERSNDAARPKAAVRASVAL